MVARLISAILCIRYIIVLKRCHKDDILYTNARWTSIRFVELIATYGCRGDSKGLLESLRNVAVVKSI